MDLLEEIIDTTEHDKVKQIILGLLTDWTEKFKYFPNYCEPEVNFTSYIDKIICILNNLHCVYSFLELT